MNVNEKTKIRLINKISESSGHLGIAGGQYLDLSYEHKKISEKKIIEDLESEKDLENSVEKYQNLLKLNNFIEKKFSKDIKNIGEKTKENLMKITSKKDGK